MKQQTTKESLNNIISPEFNFINDVEGMVRNGAGYLESILHWCQRKGIEQEQIVPLIKNNKAFHNKLTQEARDLKCLKVRKTKKKK